MDNKIRFKLKRKSKYDSSMNEYEMELDTTDNNRLYMMYDFKRFIKIVEEWDYDPKKDC